MLSMLPDVRLVGSYGVCVCKMIDSNFSGMTIEIFSGTFMHFCVLMEKQKFMDDYAINCIQFYSSLG